MTLRTSSFNLHSIGGNEAPAKTKNQIMNLPRLSSIKFQPFADFEVSMFTRRDTATDEILLVTEVFYSGSLDSSFTATIMSLNASDDLKDYANAVAFEICQNEFVKGDTAAQLTEIIKAFIN